MGLGISDCGLRMQAAQRRTADADVWQLHDGRWLVEDCIDPLLFWAIADDLWDATEELHQQLLELLPPETAVAD